MKVRELLCCTSYLWTEYALSELRPNCCGELKEGPILTFQSLFEIEDFCTTHRMEDCVVVNVVPFGGGNAIHIVVKGK